MNREILFKGKRIDNGEWVKGLPFSFHANYNLEGIETYDGERHKVDPATVGQYTGLTDKNGKKIFEGDIVSFNYDTSSVEMTDGCWGLDDGGTLLYDLEELKVIGNIHDNPELMEGY